MMREKCTEKTRREGRGRELMAEGVSEEDEAVLEAGGGFRAEGFAEGVVFTLKQPDRIDRPIKVFFLIYANFWRDFFRNIRNGTVFATDISVNRAIELSTARENSARMRRAQNKENLKTLYKNASRY